ncbi:MAG: Re/Si-specific NAD(P)(+) transhydrogenase subunit alpha [Gemmatimonadetes bacterium]|nr:Re/Si-specific NAD(P)(+) transhydrogenase subunit alpha [Gemmatimonadota bacterium]NNF37598.1 Re/Si-specific NAD(P)(+) transhydrogenase subunit alpha [Gemmatimonadota bacterium]NNK64531.1 Re/Si-specific NAD(P)(+) transhydrogenase subunit alpha [Gemmatimonadota bacterium]
MKVAVLKERGSGEKRVALIPALVRELIGKHGLDVAVEADAGAGSNHADDEYREAGATVADFSSVVAGADAVLRVAPPSPDEVAELPEGAVLLGFLSPFENLPTVRALADRKVTSFAMELVPRTTRAQRMDALSSQANLAGYKAVLLGADTLGRILPMFMTAAGTIRPGKVLILGAGVAGLQAIATARRLGARVEAFDVRPAVKEQVESLGASFLEAEEEVTAEGEGGYAKALSEEQHEKELQLIAAHIHDADIVVTTARIPGRAAPVLVTEEMLKSMKDGSVVVDMAAGPAGGNCEASRPDEVVEAHGVTVLGPTNLPSALAHHSSQMYARNIATLLLEMVQQEGEEDAARPVLALDFDNDILGPACLTHAGTVQHEATRERLTAEEAAHG